MAKGRGTTVSVMVVRTDGSVECRRAETMSTAGLVIVADCATCKGAQATRHLHLQLRTQTTSGYVVGDMSLPNRIRAHAASAALGTLDVPWEDASLSVQFDPELRPAALAILARWGLTRAAVWNKREYRI